MASKISEELGATSFDMNLPILKRLRKTKFLSMFLGLVFNIVLIVLFALSITLIYSLLLLNVDVKKFEYGLLRSLGLNKKGLVQLIIT